MRLNRICEHYGAKPDFICCSATIRNPKELAERLTGRAMHVVDNDGSPRGPRHSSSGTRRFSAMTAWNARAPTWKRRAFSPSWWRTIIKSIAFVRAAW
jgi:ATP-dependent helicase YprA (DUF1998 family)